MDMKLIAGLVLGAALVCLGWSIAPQKVVNSFGSAGSLQAGHATSSLYAVGPQQVIEIPEVASCANRSIGTLGTPIQVISSKAGISPTAARGFPQAASTTKEYDSDLWGCGGLKVFAFSSTTLTVTTYSQ